tara:strand:- start:358 stop:618 length:261 start_codon:yes stop_codon:yes gene_type:complete
MNIPINNEFVPMVYDIIRTITMQVVVQALVVANNPGIKFLSAYFIQVTLFLILGTMVFWMVIYKFLSKENLIERYIKKYTMVEEKR